ncbi:MAG: sugar transferase, partial [Oleiharenicola lentus]
QRGRFETMPGLTGLWQVSGKNRTTFDEMIRLDIRYAQTKTFWMDLRIIVMTVPALFIQIYDTRIGRKSSQPTAHTVPPFSMTERSVPVNSR